MLQELIGLIKHLPNWIMEILPLGNNILTEYLKCATHF